MWYHYSRVQIAGDLVEEDNGDSMIHVANKLFRADNIDWLLLTHNYIQIVRGRGDVSTGYCQTARVVSRCTLPMMSNPRAYDVIARLYLAYSPREVGQ